METTYSFVPAYGEWHFIDNNGNVLLNWVDPIEDLYDDFNKETGEYEDELHLMTTYEEVLGACQAQINLGHNFFDECKDATDFLGVPRELFEQLPDNAAEIMAQALYDDYIA